MMNEKQRLATVIMKHCVGLLRPIANDTDGINDREQQKCLLAIARALKKISETDFNSMALTELKAEYSRVMEWTVIIE